MAKDEFQVPTTRASLGRLFQPSRARTSKRRLSNKLRAFSIMAFLMSFLPRCRRLSRPTAWISLNCLRKLPKSRDMSPMVTHLNMGARSIPTSSLNINRNRENAVIQTTSL